ncbi:hypothetical protein, partial [Streptacidiphilus jeojiense]|uniref:hypothetical protein n=1 Tax=Streptacidiphilus jeojiense TaxID=436229 RepID=UPI0012FC50C6
MRPGRHRGRVFGRLVGWRPARPGRREVCTVSVTVLLFLVTSVQVASAATPGGAAAGGGGFLGPFNVSSAENIPLDHYALVSDPGGVTSFQQEAQSYLMSGLFALVRIVVGLECWLIHWAYSFPLVQSVASTAQQLSDAYRADVIAPLQLPGMLLAWAVVVCSVMILRGRTGRGFGELCLTFTIVAVASSALLRPDVILGSGGLLDQTHQASLEVAAITTNHGAPPAADVTASDISLPLQNTLTTTFVVQPYQLLQFGRLIPESDPAYPAYKAAVTIGPFNTDAHANPAAGCIPLPGPGGDAYCKAGAPSKPNCSGLVGTGLAVCESGNGSSTGNVRSYTDLANGFSKVDPAIAAYVGPPSWDRVIGALLLLFAVLVVAVMVLAMVLAMFSAQFADAALASCSYAALVWATLPGPSRAVLWRWVGSFVSSALVLFVAAVFLPLFGVAVSAFLEGAGTGLVPRLAMVDILALAALGFHRRLMAGAGAAGSRLANRLRWARIGGAGSGDDATRTGQVIAGALSSGGHGAGSTRGLGLGFASGSPVHAHLQRRAHLLSTAHHLADVPGIPLHPGRLLGDIRREAAHGIAPLTGAARGARHLWRGRELSPAEFERRRIRPGAGGGLPVGSRLHNRLITTRGGRTLLATGRTAWGSTLGLPAAWTRTRRRADAVRRDARAQYEHYRLEGRNYWRTEVIPGARDHRPPLPHPRPPRRLDPHPTPARRGSPRRPRPVRALPTRGPQLLAHRSDPRSPRP